MYELIHYQEQGVDLFAKWLDGLTTGMQKPELRLAW
jgi:hypothetical protein